MATKVIVTGFLAVVAGLIGLGVWGWYASDDSRAEVERIRAERVMRAFCQEYPGVDNIVQTHFGYFSPGGPGAPIEPGPPDPNDPPITVPDFEEYQYTDVERLDANAPPGLREEIDVVVDAYEQSRNSLDVGAGYPAFDEPEVAAAVDRITAYGERRCP